MTCVGPDGRDIVLSVIGDGELVGELASLDGRLRSASLTTLEPAEVLLIRGDAFASYVAAHPHLAVTLLRILAARLREADDRAIEFATLDVPGRLCLRLTGAGRRVGQADGLWRRGAAPAHARRPRRMDGVLT